MANNNNTKNIIERSHIVKINKSALFDNGE